MIRHAAIVMSTLAALGWPAVARADPPQCSGGTVTATPGQAMTLGFPACNGAGNNPTVTVVVAPVGGTLTGNPFVYTPAQGFVGVDSFVYTVTNTGTGETSEQTSVNLVVDTRPGCTDGTATAVAGQPLRIAMTAFPCTDADGSSLLIHPSDGAHGTVAADFGSGAVVYTPEPGFEGADEFEFYAADGVLQSATKVIHVTVGPAAQATPTPTPTATPVPSTPGTPPPPADTTAPKTTPKVASASIAKGVALTLAGNEAGTAKLTLTVDKATARKLKIDRKAKGAVTIGTATTKLLDGSAKVTVKLTAKARKALKRVRRLKARLTIVAADAAGNSATTAVPVVLKG
jgi:hypothetical protein